METVSIECRLICAISTDDKTAELAAHWDWRQLAGELAAHCWPIDAPVGRFEFEGDFRWPLCAIFGLFCGCFGCPKAGKQAQKRVSWCGELPLTSGRWRLTRAPNLLTGGSKGAPARTTSGPPNWAARLGLIDQLVAGGSCRRPTSTSGGFSATVVCFCCVGRTHP